MKLQMWTHACLLCSVPYSALTILRVTASTRAELSARDDGSGIASPNFGRIETTLSCFPPQAIIRSPVYRPVSVSWESHCLLLVPDVTLGSFSYLLSALWVLSVVCPGSLLAFRGMGYQDQDNTACHLSPSKCTCEGWGGTLHEIPGLFQSIPWKMCRGLAPLWGNTGKMRGPWKGST